MPVPFPTHRLCYKQSMFIGAARKYGRSPKAIEHIPNAREHVVGVGEAVLIIPRKLHPQMAGPARRKCAQQICADTLRFHFFCAVMTQRAVRDRACWIEEDVVVAVVA